MIRLRVLLVALAALMIMSCGGARPAVPSSGLDTFVLLQDPDTGVLGHATVTNLAGTGVELSSDRAATSVATNLPPSAPVTMDATLVQRVFGDAIAALPPPPQVFILRFQFDSDELTPEARLLVPQVLQAVRARPVPDVMVVGHTDTTGDAASNFALGLKRAAIARDLLVGAGLDRSAIEIKSLGEADLARPTPDNTSEPVNRRAEILVR
jgi:outer membrane protein OmpA-like peptidoglycan-associated protein